MTNSLTLTRLCELNAGMMEFCIFVCVKCSESNRIKAKLHYAVSLHTSTWQVATRLCGLEAMEFGLHAADIMPKDRETFPRFCGPKPKFLPRLYDNKLKWSEMRILWCFLVSMCKALAVFKNIWLPGWLIDYSYQGLFVPRVDHWPFGTLM